MDAHGAFRRDKADPEFLKPTVNGGNPAWVDDGTGVVVDGKRWFTAAGYAAQTWMQLIDVTLQFAEAYALTNDPAYAHKAGVLLDRIADLYPAMDYGPSFRLGMEFASGSSGWGRIQGQIWENFTATKLSRAYDLVYDALIEDKTLETFSAAMSHRYDLGDKSNGKTIASHIENHLLKEFIYAILKKDIMGNVGFRQLSMTTAAIALDHPDITPRYLDWLFEEQGGATPTILREVLCREGFSDEASLSYSSIPGRSFGDVAWLLRNYKAYDRHDLYRDFPKFRRCFTMPADVRAADRATPNWGDASKCMNIGDTGHTLAARHGAAGIPGVRRPRHRARGPLQQPQGSASCDTGRFRRRAGGGA